MADRSIGFSVTALDKTRSAFTAIAKSVDGVQRKLRGLDGTKVRIDGDVSRLTAAAAQAEKRIADLKRRIEGDTPQLDLDIREAEAKQKKLTSDLAALRKQKVTPEVELKVAQAEAALGRITAKIDALRGRKVSPEVHADLAAAEAELAGFNAELSRLDGRRVKVEVDVDVDKARAKVATVDKSFGAATIRVAALGRALGAIAMPAAIVAATPYIVSLASSAVQASGALWLLPAASLAGAAAAGTLATGFAHVSDALGPRGTPAQIKKVNEALAALSPAARAAVTTIRGLGPAWSSLRLDVQEKLFKGMAGTISSLAGTYLPILQAGMGGIAVQLNRSAAGLGAWAGQARVFGDVGRIFGQVRATMVALVPVATNVADMFLNIGAVGATFLPGLAKGFADATARAAAFIANARETGQLAVWISGALSVLRQLGQIAFSVGSILGSMFKAADSTGASFLGTLNLLTARIATALKTPEGAGQLQTFFSTVRDLVGLFIEKIVQLWPAIAAAAGAFAALLVAAAPVTDVVYGLLTSALVPLFNLIQTLAPVLGPLIAGFFLISAAMSTWSAVMSGVGAVMRVVRGLMVAWTAVQWLLNAAMAANPIALVVIAIAALVAGLIWAWNSSETFRAIVIGTWIAIKTAAVAVFTWLGTFFSAVWTAIKTVAIVAWTSVATFFAGAFNAFRGFFSAAWNSIVAVFSAVWTFIRTVAVAAWNGISAFFAGAFAAYRAFFSGVWNGIVAVFTTVWNWIRNTAVTIWTAISAYFTAAFAVYRAMFVAVWNAVSTVFTTVWNFIRNTAVTVWNWISAFFTAGFNTYRAMFTTIWNVISTVFTTVWNFIRNTAVTIWTAISSFFTNAFNTFVAFFQGIWNGIWSFFQGIWNRLYATVMYYWAQIKHYYDIALQVFAILWSRTWNDITGAFDRIWSTITGIASRVWEGVKKAFRDGVNGVIGFINIFAGAINKVAGLLGFNIDIRIPPLAEGGPVAPPRKSATSTAAGLADGGPVGLARGGNTRFRRGGRLPYTGKNRDTIPAMAGSQPYALMGQEYVVRRSSTQAIGSAGMNAINNADNRPVDIIPRASGGPVLPETTAQAHYPFLSALADGQAEAVGAANSLGGQDRLLTRLARGDNRAEKAAGRRKQTMDGYRRQFNPRVLEPIFRDLGGAIAFAKSMSGKPYVWGGTNPRVGTDCSGYQGMITNVLRNRAPARIGTTSNFPWPGFTPGLTSQYAVGAFKGNPGHMAGTLAGVNVESGGSPSRVKYGAGAAGADHGQFNIKASLPQVGGVFASGGGGGGGGGFSLRWLIEPLLRPIYEALTPMRDDVAGGFGKRAMAGGGIKLMDGILAFADSLGGGGAGMDVSGISGPVVEQVRQVANRFGWGQGPEWDAIVRLVQKESGWNPRAANPTSSARGLFQKMTSIHGPVEPTPAGQAAWGLNYIRGRYGTPSKAWSFHQANNHYDQGGLGSGRGVMFKDVLTPERVLSGRQTRSFERLVDGLVSGRPQARLSELAALDQITAGQSVRRAPALSGPGGGGVNVNVGTITTSPGVSAGEMAGALRRELRVAKHGGLHR